MIFEEFVKKLLAKFSFGLKNDKMEQATQFLKIFEGIEILRIWIGNAKYFSIKGHSLSAYNAEFDQNTQNSKI